MSQLFVELRLFSGVKRGWPRLVAALALALSLSQLGAGSACAATPAAPPAESETVAALADWVLGTGDNRGLPFVIIDKLDAAVFVFEADGQLRGAAPALLGFARGDDSTPGIGDRELSDIPPEERTTPAGRFVASYGPAVGGKKVFWVDYATAISLHPVVTAHPKEQRLKRLRTPTVADNRITFGCINVSAMFYENVVRRTFTGTKGIVYILPEVRPVEDVFPSFGLTRTASAATSATADASAADVASSSVTAAK